MRNHATFRTCLSTAFFSSAFVQLDQLSLYVDGGDDRKQGVAVRLPVQAQSMPSAQLGRIWLGEQFSYRDSTFDIGWHGSIPPSAFNSKITAV
jgi:hypothetical protein